MPLNAALRTEPLELVPYDLLATRPWLMERGIARHAVDNLVKSGQLIPLRPSVYVRPGSRLVWQGIVCSLQRMCDDLVVGGTTALELHGRAHHLPLTRRRRDVPPAWHGMAVGAGRAGGGRGKAFATIGLHKQFLGRAARTAALSAA